MSLKPRQCCMSYTVTGLHLRSETEPQPLPEGGSREGQQASIFTPDVERPSHR